MPTLAWIVILILSFFSGYLVGLFVCYLTKKPPVGYLRIDRSDPDGDFIFIEFTKSPDRLQAGQVIQLVVKQENYIEFDNYHGSRN